MKGRLTVITGCMSSGKTEELLRLLRRQEIAGKNYMIIKHSMDNRASGGCIESRAGHVAQAAVADNGEIVDIVQDAQDSPDRAIEIVAIEESQFFDYSLVESIWTLLQDGYDVYVTGLNQDFRGEPFSIMPDLMAMSDYLVFLNAVCKVCGKDATMTQRLIDGRPAPYESEQIQVGGDEAYEARCRDCHEVPSRAELLSNLTKLSQDIDLDY